jgi:hypothetical protein
MSSARNQALAPKGLTRAEAAEPHATDGPTWLASTTMVAAQVLKAFDITWVVRPATSPRRRWRKIWSNIEWSVFIWGLESGRAKSIVLVSDVCLLNDCVGLRLEIMSKNIGQL